MTVVTGQIPTCFRIFSGLVLGLFFCTQPISAQWGEASNLSGELDTASTSYTTARCVAASGSVIHTIWSHWSVANWGATYRRSTDLGRTWEEPVILAPALVSVEYLRPSIAACNTDVHAVWCVTAEGMRTVYYRHSTDDGVTWGEERVLSAPNGDCYAPMVAVMNNHVHVIWTADDMMGKNLIYRKSDDGGETWNEEEVVVPSFFALGGTIAVSGSTVHLAYMDMRWGYSEIVYRHSTDDGETWEEEQRMTDWMKASTGPSIAAEGNDVHLLWHDFYSGSLNVFYKYSWDGGKSWGAEQQMTMWNVDPWGAGWPCVAVCGSQVHVTWGDYRRRETDDTAPSEVYYMTSPDAGVTWQEEIPLSIDSLYAYGASVAVSGSSVHTVWRSAGRIIRHRCNPTGNSGVSTAAVVPIIPGFALSQNYPNPFREQSSMRFTIPHATHVRLSLHDMLGRQLRVIVDDVREAGNWLAPLDASQLPPGNYICRLQAGEVQLSRIVTVQR